MRFGLQGKLLSASLGVVALSWAIALYLDGATSGAGGADPPLYVIGWPGLVALTGTLVASGGLLATYVARRQARRLADLADKMRRALGAPPRSSSDDDVVAMADAFRHLTAELGASQESMADVHARFMNVLEALGEGVVTCDPRGRVTLVNQEARDILELGEAAVGTPLLELNRLPAVGDVLNLRTAREVELELPGPPRRQVTAAVYPSADNSRVIVARDVTAMRQLETAATS